MPNSSGSSLPNSTNDDLVVIDPESLDDVVVDAESERKLMSEMREKATARLTDIGVTGVTGDAVAGIICSLIKEHLRKLEIERNTDRTLSLPDEMLTEIFSKMTTEERAPLGLTCKRFRELDFELGKKTFDTIKVTCGHSGLLSICGKAPKTEYNLTETETGMFVYPKKITTFHPTYHNLRLFRNAEVEVVDISYHNEKKFADKFNLISKFLETVKYKRLSVRVKCEEDCTENFLPTLMKNRNLESTQVRLNFIGDSKSHTAHSMERMREFIMQLPKIDKFKLVWIGRRPKSGLSWLEQDDDRLLNDENLLHIVSQTNQTELYVAYCTVEGVMKAFEKVFLSPIHNKYVSCYIDKKTFKKVFSAAHFGLQKKVTRNDVRLIDRKRGSIMIGHERKISSMCTIYMGKMKDDEIIPREFVEGWE